MDALFKGIKTLYLFSSHKTDVESILYILLNCFGKNLQTIATPELGL